MSIALVAPVAAQVLASALTHPHLLEDVAFGTRQRGLDLPEGTPVYLAVAPDGSPHRDLVRPGFVTWTGTLGALVPAVAHGPRRGMHPDPARRPPFAERYDYRDAAMFWHLRGLAPLAEPMPVDRFRNSDGTRMFGGRTPQWIARATLASAGAAMRREKLLRAA